MTTQVHFKHKKHSIPLLICIFLCFGFQQKNYAFNEVLNDTLRFNKYKGKVVDSKTKKVLVFASLNVNGTNISTITNSQGTFSLKVPKEFASQKLTVSFLGYTSKVLNLSSLSNKNNVIKLETYIEELSEVEVKVKDAKALMKEVLKRRGENYFNEDTNMTAFYRETIKKRRTYVSLAEAVVTIDKQAYTAARNDIVQLHKARKSTDYNRLDTIALKLRGGPHSNLFVDVMKNPDIMFSRDMLDYYDFHLGKSTKIDNKPVYVVNFKQKATILDPLFYGKLFIEAKSLALVKAKFHLNIEDKEKASKLFVLKKPKKATVYPIETNYQVDYRVKDNKWYYGYSRIELGFKVNWDKKLFNSVYYSTSEMAITDWEKNNDAKIKAKDRLKSTVILSDEALGFSDPKFWGDYNVIEPEKPIESAIKKIQKQLKKLK